MPRISRRMIRCTSFKLVNLLTKKILFVCLGNICRSPAAEGVLHTIAQRSQADIQVDSAGTSSFHIGEPADKRMRAAAAKRGYDLTSRSRMVTRRDFSEFDLVIAMDRNNYRELSILAGGTTRKLKMLSDFLGEDWPRDVPDPYYGGDDGFEKVLDMLEAACPKILDTLTTETGSSPA
ncbi:MAG: low molecular weight protein-tyrosine-phosphatase [Pirellulaceae bacterium]|nr:low molecular weight protein-tyrosine-phosphatase [Pirellulaceae bacterium]